ncbi:hypothetical protein M5K25_018273 [Dendrobium thyrsiflorum]|uniref:Uncharacterized protein n=1 Tax=Dendrobium thyrsiflorum TaxID=117978 RepID=A0ABD0UI77_DENTH
MASLASNGKLIGCSPLTAKGHQFVLLTENYRSSRKQREGECCCPSNTEAPENMQHYLGEDPEIKSLNSVFYPLNSTQQQPISPQTAIKQPLGEGKGKGQQPSTEFQKLALGTAAQQPIEPRDSSTKVMEQQGTEEPRSKSQQTTQNPNRWHRNSHLAKHPKAPSQGTEESLDRNRKTNTLKKRTKGIPYNSSAVVGVLYFGVREGAALFLCPTFGYRSVLPSPLVRDPGFTVSSKGDNYNAGMYTEGYTATEGTTPSLTRA